MPNPDPFELASDQSRQTEIERRKFVLYVLDTPAPTRFLAQPGFQMGKGLQVPHTYLIGRTFARSTAPLQPRLDLPPRVGTASRTIVRRQVLGNDALVSLRQRRRVKRPPLAHDC